MLSIEGMNEEDLFKLCADCDGKFDGKFYLGVLTTKIYCLPSCKAKMPFRKNVKMFESRDEAIKFGLRGCKRCKSEFYPVTQPSWFDPLLELVNSIKDRKLDLKELEILTKVNISTIGRYFKNYLDLTLNSYHRTIRLEHAKELLHEGESLLDIPYLTGFSSLSGFRSAFYNEFGKNPGELLNGS
ncbi:MAG: Bifunctional transcriptional activator/DNA repair enzyme AdaA [Candidatus Heimdallarchaeota archaeon LC_2]|nr:MAG: Bifunctional transcriptional activator/DNA repair enzyme AdaA [Candidatus Heimdallarchaeota archaeon LC_2]